MNVLTQDNLTRLWGTKIKKLFVSHIGVTHSASDITISLKNRMDTPEELESISLNAASATTAGLMLPAQFTKINNVPTMYSALGSNTDGSLTQAASTSLLAPIASPALTGIPTTPTAALDTNTPQIASCAFVITQINDGIASAVGFAGTKATVAEVQAIASAKRGDLYIITEGTDAGQEWVCTTDITTATPSAWTKIGSVVTTLGLLAYKNDASASYTPAGTVSTAAADTDTVYSIDSVGSMPTLRDTVSSDGVLKFTYTDGTTPTRSAKTVATNGVKSVSWTGTAATITVS